MAQYDVNYSCGHQGRISLFGKTSTRQWQLKQEESKLCPECFKLERERQNAEAATANQAAGLPALTGTPAQISWAEKIRQDALTRIDPIAERMSDKGKEIVAQIKAVNKASWWIDNRLEFVPPINLHRFAEFLIQQQEKLTNAPISKAEIPEAQIAKLESTVRPEKAKTETIAEILTSADKVKIVFPERRDDFRTLVKSLGYRWDDTAWVRTINKRNGPLADRIAEAGHKLLAAGFVVCIYNEETREMAISGTYEAEQTRWVAKRIATPYEGWFCIQWGEDDDFYKASRKLPGSRWNKSEVVVPPEQFEQVLDFAQMYGFSLSEGAESLVEAAKAAKEAMLVAAVAPAPKKRKAASTRIPVLDTPKEVAIDAELRDENSADEPPGSGR